MSNNRVITVDALTEVISGQDGVIDYVDAHSSSKATAADIEAIKSGWAIPVPPYIPPETHSWSSIADADLPDVIAAADAGRVDLVDDLGWAVGDERQITIANYPLQPAISVTFTLVLSDPGHFELETPTAAGDDHCRFVMIVKKTDEVSSPLASTSAQANDTWDNLSMRSTLNGDILNALPSGLKTILKPFKVSVANGHSSSSTAKTVVDTLSLFSEKELFGSNTYSCSAEAAACTQLDYYKTASNIAKQYWYWTRSAATDSSNWCVVNYSGGVTTQNGYSDTAALSFFGCI